MNTSTLFVFGLVNLLPIFGEGPKKYVNIIAKGTNDDERNFIVNVHNLLRSMLANGDLVGQPKAADMERIEWDEQLARKAQNVADKMIYKRKEVKDDRWEHVGQNMIQTYTTTYKLGADWCWALSSWMHEVKLYTYGDVVTDKTADYVQMVWANTTNIGCAYTDYLEPKSPLKFRKLYVCNYGPGRNIPKEIPYKISPPKGYIRVCKPKRSVKQKRDTHVSKTYDKCSSMFLSEIKNTSNIFSNLKEQHK